MKKLILLLVLTSNAFITNAQVNIQDSLALVALYNSTDGPNWNDCNYGWLVLPVDQWNGINVDSGRVVGINLHNNNNLWTSCELYGTIPPEIGNLTRLKNLDLSNNNLYGQIPVELYNLTDLEYLALSLNQLIDTIASGIGNLIKLKGLYLDNNYFYGNLPSEIGNLNSLMNLYLHSNKFTGSIPSTFINFHQLGWLALSRNLFSSLPDLTSLYYHHLQSWSVSNNKLIFDDLEPNVAVQWSQGFGYSPQDSVFDFTDTTVFIHSSIAINSQIGGTHNVYLWKKNDTIISNATDSVLQLNNILPQDSGIYICDVTNSIVPNLTITRRPFVLHVIDTTTSVISIEKNKNEIIKITVKDNKVFIISNPTSRTIQTIEIFNNVGSILFFKNIGGYAKQYEFNLNFIKGIYCVTVKTKENSFNLKVLIY